MRWLIVPILTLYDSVLFSQRPPDGFHEHPFLYINIQTSEGGYDLAVLWTIRRRCSATKPSYRVIYIRCCPHKGGEVGLTWSEGSACITFRGSKGTQRNEELSPTYKYNIDVLIPKGRPA
ncbi:hypothetical protein BX666DRAFT_1347075 [Dichotomocladium elegans]|nr:hypothetical protein BX666DRAFT_1347075 [Dichotomocladium elegans]